MTIEHHASQNRVYTARREIEAAARQGTVPALLWMEYDALAAIAEAQASLYAVRGLSVPKFARGEPGNPIRPGEQP